MARSFPSPTAQAHSFNLRNQICRLASPLLMAEASSHLRDFAVAETVGVIAMLDGHRQIVQPPSVGKSPALFQQAGGTSANPFTHVIPCTLLLQGDTILQFYRTQPAREMIERTFGMGVMAPDDWEDLGSFSVQPRQHNIADNIAERYHAGDGLVDAFIASAQVAVDRGVWNGSGHARHDLSSLVKFIRTIYINTWTPKARAAYAAARTHVASALAKPNSSSNPKLGQRLNILDAQIRIFERDMGIFEEAARNVIKATAGESWIGPRANPNQFSV